MRQPWLTVILTANAPLTVTDEGEDKDMGVSELCRSSQDPQSRFGPINDQHLPLVSVNRAA